jgi:hypothetical protein
MTFADLYAEIANKVKVDHKLTMKFVNPISMRPIKMIPILTEHMKRMMKTMK